MKIENYKRAEQILSTISKLDDLKDCIDKFDDVEWSFNYKAVLIKIFQRLQPTRILSLDSKILLRKRNWV